ncbi:MAG: DNA repair protein RecO [Calothrix sp. SM1_5_4]|nr:DNA repair protein RecO [Calothrix sp. SM1_5_4]
MTAKEKIIVLKTFKHGEADLIVHGLNHDGARMSFFARGGLKSRKRFGGGLLEATHYIEVTYKVSRAEEAEPLHTLIEAQMLREFPKLRTHYDRLEAALYILKLVHKMGQHGVIDSPDLFNLLGNALAAAETSSDLEKLKLHFELKVLAGQGVLPHEEAYRPWILTSLARHEQIASPGEDRRRIQAQVHDHLRHYLGFL